MKQIILKIVHLFRQFMKKNLIKCKALIWEKYFLLQKGKKVKMVVDFLMFIRIQIHLHPKIWNQLKKIKLKIAFIMIIFLIKIKIRRVSNKVIQKIIT